MNQVTQILAQMQQGDPQAAAQLLPLVYDELRRLAAAQLASEKPGQTLVTRLSSSPTLPSLAVGRNTEPARLTKLVRGELDWIVMKALEKDRNRRYETANGFALDVQRYLAGEPVLAAPPSARYRLRKFARKHRGGRCHGHSAGHGDSGQHLAGRAGDSSGGDGTGRRAARRGGRKAGE